jgi:hypothetical protein
VQSEQFNPPGRYPTVGSLDREFVRDDDEFALAEYDESEGEAGRQWLPSLWLLLGMAVLGVVLALIWHNVKPKLSFASLSTQTISTAGPPGLVQDVEALKRMVTEVRESQQQLEAKAAALEVAQRHMQQELSSHSAAKWYSDTTMLMYRTSTAQQPKPSSSPKPRATPQSQSDPQNASATQRDRGPLPLATARP